MKNSKEIPYSLDPANPAGVESIHQVTLEVLAETGVLVESKEAVDLLVDAGATDCGQGLVRIPPSLVAWALTKAPSTLTMYTRDGQEVMLLKPGNVYLGTGSDCPNVIDIKTGRRRPAVKNDIAELTRLTDALPEIDFVLSMGLASDARSISADLYHFQAMVANTTKPIFYTVTEPENLPIIIEMAEAIVGGKSILAQKPFIAHFAMPSPPLRHTSNALTNLIHCARNNMPVVYASGTQMGLSGPMSVDGSTLSSNCDVLSGLIIHQLANPGAPFIYGVCIAPFDMKTSIEAYGAPEHYLGDALNMQMARHYNLPSWGYAGSTDSKTLDMQAAIEYLGSTMAGMMSGCNLLHDVGYLESGMSASKESILFGNEVIAFARRILQKVDVNRETLSAEAIKQRGPGGSFLMDDYTIRQMREFWYSPLIDRKRYDAWIQSGRTTMLDRIIDRVKHVMATHWPTPLDPAIAAEIERMVAVREQMIG
jgi:trimethylamine--corrinoid protein Co-methyltransferase